MNSLNDFTCTITSVERCLNIFNIDCMHKRESVVWIGRGGFENLRLGLDGHDFVIVFNFLWNPKTIGSEANYWYLKWIRFTKIEKWKQKQKLAYPN